MSNVNNTNNSEAILPQASQQKLVNTIKLDSINAEQFREIVGNKFFCVQFLKKSGEVRNMNARLGVTKFLRGGQDSTQHIDKYINVYENKDTFYKKVNMETVQQLTANGTTYIVGSK